MKRYSHSGLYAVSLGALVLAACAAPRGPGDTCRRLLRDVEAGQVSEAMKMVTVSGDLSGALPPDRIRAGLSDLTRQIAAEGGIDHIDIIGEYITGAAADVGARITYGNGDVDDERASMTKVDGAWTLAVTDEALRHYAFFSAMKSDLKDLATLEEIYYSTHRAYTSNVVDLAFVNSEFVTVGISANGSGWSASATHSALGSGRGCAIYYGTAAAPTIGNTTPTNPGTLRCTN